jgi:hypothetical protein
MFIRWTFAFHEGHLAVEVREEKEDQRISESVNSGVELLLIPGQGKDAYINLKRCKAIVREEINEEATTSSQTACEISNESSN